MRCVECGHELKDGAIFCIRCGAMQINSDGTPVERVSVGKASDSQVSKQQIQPMHASNTVRRKEFQQPPSGNGKRIALLAVVLVAVIAAIGALAYFLVGPGSTGSGSASSEAAVVSSASDESSDSASSSAASSDSSASASASSASASAAGASASAASASAASGDASANAQAPQPEPTPTIVEEQPAPAPEPVYTDNSYYVLPDSSSRYYSWGELDSMGTYDLYLARNEVYARHGRMFQRSDLQSYFNGQSWYNPSIPADQFDTMTMLTDVERQNVDLMRQVEASRNSPYL